MWKKEGTGENKGKRKVERRSGNHSLSEKASRWISCSHITTLWNFKKCLCAWLLSCQLIYVKFVQLPLGYLDDMWVIWGGQDTKESLETSLVKTAFCFLLSATSKSETVIARASRFDVGSFVGGIVLTLCVLVILYIGCKTYHSRRGIQYRTM